MILDGGKSPIFILRYAKDENIETHFRKRTNPPETRKHTMSNAEKFIDIYNRIDKHLKNDDNETHESFANKIRKSSNPIIKQKKEKLISFGELRNAIVHNSKIGERYIAEPLEEIVDEFEEILKILKCPPKVFPLFSAEIVGAKKNDKLDQMLKIMREKSFSQFPIFNDDENVIEIINTNTISRWLGENIIDDEIMMENPKISDLVESIEFKKNYKYISKDCDIYSAYDLFVKQIEKQKRNLDVLFITHSGNEREKLLGLITIEDIADKISLNTRAI
jgi:predicted transcriptional regulator